MRLKCLINVDLMLFEIFKSHELKGFDICGSEFDLWSATGFACFFPTHSAQTPAVATLQPFEPILGAGRYKVISLISGEL